MQSPAKGIFFQKAVKMGQKKHLKNGNGEISNVCAPEPSLLVKNCSFTEIEQSRNAICQRLWIKFHMEKEWLPLLACYYYAQPLTKAAMERDIYRKRDIYIYINGTKGICWEFV